MERLTAERLREVIHYDPVIGIFTWVASGKRAGTAPTKTRLYRRIGINGGEYLEQVLAVLYMTGRWPADEVDHDNRDKIDNRWVNLREATRGQNQANTPVYRNNAQGLKGVGFDKRSKRYTAQIRRDGQVRWLGTFSSAQAAHAAYVAATGWKGD